jgi:hypothetical protein
MEQEKPLTLAEALANPKAGKDSSECKLMKVRLRLDDDDRKSLDQALILIKADDGNGRSKTYSTSWLCKVLKDFGHAISTSSVQRHLNGACGCE